MSRNIAWVNIAVSSRFVPMDVSYPLSVDSYPILWSIRTQEIMTNFWEFLSEKLVFFTITTEIHARSLAIFYCQYADRHMNLKFMRRISEREPAIRQFVIVKIKLMSGFNASVLLLIMNLVITLSK